MTIRDWSAFIGGRVALVTGAGAGIGRAIAIQMARAGARIWVNDLDPGRAGGVCDEIRAEGGEAQPVIADVCDGDAVAAMSRATGPLDILVNNAGSGVRSWQRRPATRRVAGDWSRNENLRTGSQYPD